MKIDLRKDKPTTFAEFESKCAVCGDSINEGDKIIKDEDDNWIHEDCDDS